jgi:hypothetical protein
MSHETRFLNPDPQPRADLAEWRPSAKTPTAERHAEKYGMPSIDIGEGVETPSVSDFGFYHPAANERGGRYAE